MNIVATHDEIRLMSAFLPVGVQWSSSGSGIRLVLVMRGVAFAGRVSGIDLRKRGAGGDGDFGDATFLFNSMMKPWRSDPLEREGRCSRTLARAEDRVSGPCVLFLKWTR
jgi:hypothetical protein